MLNMGTSCRFPVRFLVQLFVRNTLYIRAFYRLLFRRFVQLFIGTFCRFLFRRFIQFFLVGAFCWFLLGPFVQPFARITRFMGGVVTGMPWVAWFAVDRWTTVENMKLDIGIDMNNWP